ncbi:hypothetical protein SDC9_11837 [bioreactor metagenome]|uniref:Uncharacterized protein n=1 Tax=bioreactor metagenome TaxID=1076179 RepID=A0A644TGQ9_9ZZZZ
MNLFELVVEKSKLHHNFRAVMGMDCPEEVISIKESLKKEREILQSWCENFPDRDNKLVKEFQTTFNSSFWEIYLYKLFTDYGFKFNWDYSSPDFYVNLEGIEFIVEATTANKADDEKPNEWDKEEPLANVLNRDAYLNYQNNMNEANRYSMIRLSNSILSKHKKYKDSYSRLDHVKNKPFIVAIAPFEQPFFYYQYNRPIMALLYDIYVNEELYYKNPNKYSFPPTEYLNSIEKDNGSEIPLGFFNNDSMKEISAIIFSPLATWSKTKIYNDSTMHMLNFLTNDGTKVMIEKESIEDGLFIFHNPYAKYPLDKSLFRKGRICQVYLEDSSISENKNITYSKLENGKYLILEFNEKHLFSRNSISFSFDK